MENKKLRFNLKQQLLKEKEQLDKRFQDTYQNKEDFSFNEYGSSYNENGNEYEDENNKIKKEAKDLIAKTRKMMENLDLDKIKLSDKSNKSPRLNSPSNLSQSLRNSTSPLIQKSSQSMDEEITLKNHLNLNLNTLNQRLIEKTKLIKSMDKEVKEKNSIIEKLHQKIEKKNEEISKLNEILTKERSCNLKVEVSTLQRKLTTKEKQCEENKKVYENLINEHKAKITNLMNFNDTSVKKIKQLKSDNENLSEINKNINYEKAELESNLKIWKEKFEIEQKSKIKYKSDLENHTNKIKIVFNLLKSLFEKNKSNKFTENEFLEKLRIFCQNDYREELYNNQMRGSNNNNENRYDYQNSYGEDYYQNY